MDDIINPEQLWQQCKDAGFITADEQRVMVTLEQLEALYEQARESALDACAMGH